MILVKKRYLLALTSVLCLLVIFGELKFFMALQSINMHTNLTLKYEVENFIFAAIVVLITVVVFFFAFIRASENVLRRLDKMIELSEYGKHDVSSHMEKLGVLGTKVNHLTYNLNSLSSMRAVKISSLSDIIDFLMDRSGDMVILTDYKGRILDCSSKMASEFNVDKSRIAGLKARDILKEENFDDLISGVKDARKAIKKEKIVLEIAGKEKKCVGIFYPVINSDKQISNFIGVFGTSNILGF